MKLPFDTGELAAADVTMSSGNRTLSRLERFRRVQTPEGCSGVLRGKGKKGGVVVAQPLGKAVLKPLYNSFKGDHEIPKKVVTRTDCQNIWFKTNKKTPPAYEKPATLLSKKPLTGLVLYNMLETEKSFGSYPSLLRSRCRSSFYDETRDVAALADTPTEAKAPEDVAFQELVACTKAKYRMAKWTPHACTVWDVYRERDVQKEVLRVKNEVKRLSTPT
eukprot:TRINITY_DN37840_c0_g1_i1.p1 TRINITY_DN37840_c0_g1~~TRINITY_DN37840_c0_g1_i1.p1  ORF type:complete len:233 (+),score=42.10 TRINITY_DN37840_c0_g1_i1:43-699(+)